MTPSKFVRRALGPALAVLTVAALTVAPASSTPLTTYRAVFFYGGTEASHNIAFERPTSFSPIELAQTLNWDYSWMFSCGATVSFTTDAQGRTLGCNATNGAVWGQYNDNFSFPNLGTDCQATYSKAPGGSLGLGGAFTDTKGQILRVTAYSPPNGPVLIATPTCGWPPGNIVFASGISTVANLKLPDDSGLVIPVTARGVLTGFSGEVRFSSDLMVNVTSSSFASDSMPTDLLRVWSDQIGQWIGDRIDSLRPDSGSTFASGSEIPYLEALGRGHAWVTASADDPIPLFSVHQTFAANVPTKLNATLPPSALKTLAAATGPVRLHLRIVFQPDHGAATTYAETYVPHLSSAVTSVTFTGSAASPTITIHGSGLSPLAPPDPASLSGEVGCPVESGQTGADYGGNLSVTDVTAGWGAGRNLTGIETDCIGLIPTSSSASTLVLRPGSFYSTSPKFALRNGDKVQVVVNGALLTVHVRYGATVSS